MAKTQSSDVPEGTFADLATDRTLRALLALARALPYARRVAMMGWITRHIIGPLAGYRKRALVNLAMIYPEMPPERRREIADTVLDNMGRTLIENYSSGALDKQLQSTQITGEGLAALAEAKAAGRPVLFLTAHFSNYEVPRHILHRMGYTIGGIYRPMRNPYFNSHYVQTMEGVSGPVFPQGRRGTMGFVRHLRAGGMATLLFDVHDLNGTQISFLGQPALTSLSAAEMALKFDALLIPYFATRTPDGLNFTAVLEAPIPHSDPVTMMTMATKRLEARIAATPGQWFWVHRRWKAPKSA
ncbi:Kdo2-lipid IVA lauroyltransferase [Ketogulonicigenium robustum]|uniref:Kdo2-lipid IVA lauroyltransferase n=1 Tax=Ketogulonicigenium robustum TaxID=92947 RepID=A0A1W6P186_9RHOB|nr:lysophospholipid acyltransferase family protein [Ketogulonicigenium robustum]ARO15204.1 Kdo2-lipid IVA lauroyltransferase [Ketogulonicigenium robustum]